jgi:hypothetical protein
MIPVWSPEAIGDFAALRAYIEQNRTILRPRNALRFTSSGTLKHYFPTIPKWGDPAESLEHANS